MIKLKKTHTKGTYRAYNGDEDVLVRVVKVIQPRKPTHWVVYDSYKCGRVFNSKKEVIDYIIQILVERILAEELLVERHLS